MVSFINPPDFVFYKSVGNLKGQYIHKGRKYQWLGDTMCGFYYGKNNVRKFWRVLGKPRFQPQGKLKLCYHCLIK